MTVSFWARRERDWREHLGGSVRRLSHRKSAEKPREKRVPRQHVQQFRGGGSMHVTEEEEKEEESAFF